MAALHGMILLLQGFALGLAFAAPLGAQNVYVIRAAISAPMTISLRVATLVSIADIALAQACLLGMGILLKNNPWLANGVNFVGTCFLLFSGLQLVRPKRVQSIIANPQASQAALSWGKIGTSAILLTWFNPQGFVDGSLILGGVRAHLLPRELPFFATGLAFASAAWFFGLTIGLGSFRSKISSRHMDWMNKACGVLLCVLALLLSQ